MTAGPGPALPGGVGISHVRVYDTVGPDGLAGGTPHLHTVCTEAYLVTDGEGEVHTLSAEGFRRTPVERGSAVWFGPGTVHRLVNHGGLELFVVMSNAGLPEAGDLVIVFDDAVLADRDRYAEASTLPAAPERRDLAVDAFGTWRARFDEAPAAAMDHLHRLAGAIVAPRATGWGEVVARSVGDAARRAADRVAALERGDLRHLAGAAVASSEPHRIVERRLGCCGTLGVVDHPVHL